ncbi:MAG: hypothetical protein ACTHWA_09255 [Arachnia sp.]
MTHTVLFVCYMNVCRSPLMQWTFLDSLPERDQPTFEVFSRGVDASPDQAICEVSAPMMWGSETGREFTRSHKSARLRPSDLISPGLIIVATRSEASILSRHAPQLRCLTFTLREANLLGARPTSAAEHAFILKTEEAEEGPLPLHGFPHLLNRRRGTIALPKPKSRRQRRIDPFDVPDAHLGRPSTHGKVLREVRAETKDLVSRFLEFRDERPVI